MKKRIRNFLYAKAIRLIALHLFERSNKLTAAMLMDKGWIPEYDNVRQKTFLIEPNVKDRDMVLIEFENDYYRVWHGRDKTFISLESSIEWLQLHLLLLDKHKQFTDPLDLLNAKL